MTAKRYEAEPSAQALEAGEWCRRVAEGDMSDGQVEAFETWMEADPANRAAFDRASFIWRALDGRAAPPELVSVRVDALEALGTQPIQDNVGPQHYRRRWPAVAASLLALFLVGSLMLWPRGQSFETGVGERRVVMLDDGSRLSLDAASKVGVTYSDDRRSLTLLSGRAKFDVAKNALRPFSVTAGGKLIVATGTSFSVEMLAGKVDVVLYEGHVAVLDAETGAPAPVRTARQLLAADQLMVPGSELSLPASGVGTLTEVDLGRSAAWEAGQLSFSDEPLGEAVARMNRYATTPLALGDPRVGGIPISGVFNAADTSGFVTGITGVFPVRSLAVDGKIVLISDDSE
ncbi:FecR family protein [Sphingosinicella rhizophila]|uniref:FecR domain-containing protein n=1 Tax=Sphingosinicella rhizophila TaxID=3050082 RepID=A0ABU3Q1U8_9SPHN|nr:FecR domain-containing protein [Sphingosinicella sp. GR2756]MDT9597368.1 FecR domain-containing protein [Sphingosinicella sp. GR2756]